MALCIFWDFYIQLSICVRVLRFILPGIQSPLGTDLHRSPYTFLECINSVFCIGKYSHSSTYEAWHCPVPFILSIFQNERY